MTTLETRDRLITIGRKAGFDRIGIAAAKPIGRLEYLREWLRSGSAGEMSYLHQHADERIDPRVLFPGAKSVVVFALSYNQPAHQSRPQDRRARGRVAMYAWGRDYHKVMKKKIFSVLDELRRQTGSEFPAKVCVDTAPIVEREFAAAAGIGWIGKNTLVLNQELGSYFFLGVAVTTLELPVDNHQPDHCGTCTACLDACPTDALPEPYRMEATQCISYLTIEHRSDIDRKLQPLMEDWVFGCDICQEVCPYNNKAAYTRETAFAVTHPGPRPRLDEILRWTKTDYDENVRGSATKRARLNMWKRNAQIAQTNLYHVP